MSSHLLKTTCFLLVLALTSSCTKSKSPVEAEPAPPMGIVWGESIEGVAIGDDSLTVIAKLGQPTKIWEGDLDGNILVYDEGKLALTFVTISRDPAFGLGVIGVKVEPPYSGKAKDGIGIGSERNFVINKLGQPDRMDEEMPITDKYYYQNNDFSITYCDEYIHRITMVIPHRY